MALRGWLFVLCERRRGVRRSRWTHARRLVRRSALYLLPSSLLALTPPLARSSSKCNGIDLGEYNMDLHIVALLCVLVSLDLLALAH